MHTFFILCWCTKTTQKKLHHPKTFFHAFVDISEWQEQTTDTSFPNTQKASVYVFKPNFYLSFVHSQDRRTTLSPSISCQKLPHMQDGQILYIRVNRTYLSTTTTTTTLDSNSFLSSELSISAVWGRSGRFIFSSPLSCIVCTVMTRCNSRRRLFHCHLTFSLYLYASRHIRKRKKEGGWGKKCRHRWRR